MDAPMKLDTLMGLPPAERVGPLARLAIEIADHKGGNGVDDAQRARLVEALVSLVDDGVGAARERLQLGEALGLLGDPRLNTPADPAYWVRVGLEDGDMAVGRFPVTNAEYQRFVDAGGYDRPELWTPGGLEWLERCEDPWPVRAANTSSQPFIIPNQPVVGVTWFEAIAFARYHGARLARFDERLWISRGDERRPYPWGSPFGEGNANTKEEVLGRPCAVGLYVRDRTPEGVFDLAGNVAEWTLEGVGDEKWIHPGSWDQPSMAAWAKARSLEAPDNRWPGLGFRLAKD